MLRSEIDSIPLAGDVEFRERTVESHKAALLVIDVQNGQYNAGKARAQPQHAYLWDRITTLVIPNGQRQLARLSQLGGWRRSNPLIFWELATEGRHYNRHDAESRY